MKIRLNILLIIVLLFSLVPIGICQENHTLSGTILDQENGEVLIGATVYVKSLERGAAANEYGFYSLTLPSGKYLVVFNYLGFESIEISIDLTSDLRQDAELQASTKQIEEVVVKGTSPDANVRSPEMSVTRLSVKEIRAIPVLFGEQDVLKTIQLLPGVQAAGEGSTGYYVRGGDAGQNLLLLDEANVYNPSHLLGFFSVFNSDAINDIKLYKGGIPAEYGGRIASVLDINMKNGNLRKYHLSGGIGLISSRLMFEGPIVKDKGSFLVTARRTYADLFLKFSRDTLINNNTLFFYDLNLKANYKLGENDRIFLSAYFGRDKFLFQDRFGIEWGNATATFRWNHLFSNKLFLNSTFIYSNYNYVIKILEGDNKLDIISSIRDFSLKEDFQYFINPENTLKFGGQLIHHTFIPGEVTADEYFQVNNLKLTEKYALEPVAYISHQFQPFPWLNLDYGLRFSYYLMIGPGDAYTFDDAGNVTDSIHYDPGKIMARYPGLGPRITANFRLTNTQSLKLSFNRIHQYIHLLSNTSSESPTDVWLPSSNNVKPQIGDQVAIGYFRNFKENEWETSVEAYYKNMYNQIDYKNGAEIILNEKVESQLVFGTGWAYGLEFLVKKNQGKFHGWISYTWAKSMRKFESINSGEPYPAKQDRTHDVSVVLMYELNDKWSFSGTFVYYTGNAVTFPSGKYQIENKTVNMYTERNGYRMPPYNRLDIGATRMGKKREKFESSWNFSIYNVYARKNAWAISFRENENDPSKTEAVRLSLFSIVPSVTWNFKF